MPEGAFEAGIVQLGSGRCQAVAFDGLAEAAGYQFGQRSLAAATCTPAGVVILAAAHLLHEGQDASGRIGAMGRQPFAEQVPDFQRQSQEHIGGIGCTSLGCGLEEGLDLAVGQAGNDRRHHDGCGNAGLGQSLDRVEAAVGRSGARFHLACQFAVQRGDGDCALGEAFSRHRTQNVEIAQDQGGLGDEDDRVPVAGEDLEQVARVLQPSFDRLPGICIGPDHEWGGFVAGAVEMGFQKGRAVRLGHDDALEVQARRIAQIRVAGPGVAIDAAMLAASIGIDRLVEGNVG